MEHELMQSLGDEETNHGPLAQVESVEEWIFRLSNNSEPHDSPLALAMRYSRSLDLGLPIPLFAANIADAADSYLDSRRDRPAGSIAAASLYIASHILHEPRPLEQIARVTAVSEDTIENIYKEIYADRYELIDEDWQRIVGGATLGEAAEALPSLTWPPLRHGSIDNSATYTGFGGESSLYLVKGLCYQFHAEYNMPLDEFAIENIRPVAENIAERLNNMSCNWGTANPWTIAAACTYMASHLVFRGKTIAQISAMSGIPSALFRETYEIMYRVRELIVVPEDWLRDFPAIRAAGVDSLPEP